MRGRPVSIGYPFVGDPARRALWCLSWRYGPSELVPLFHSGAVLPSDPMDSC